MFSLKSHVVKYKWIVLVVHLEGVRLAPNLSFRQTAGSQGFSYEDDHSPVSPTTGQPGQQLTPSWKLFPFLCVYISMCANA